MNCVSQKFCVSPKLMKVLILGAFPPPHGGLQTHVVALREFLISRGISCEGIHLTRHRQLDGNGLYYPRTALALAKLLLRLRYDVIHIHVGGDLTLRLLGLCLFCSLLPGKPTFLTFHSGGYPSSPAARTARPLSMRGFIFRRLNGIIGVNRDLVELFCRFGVPKERVRLILPYAFRPVPSKGDLPAPLGDFFQQHDPVLITVGLLEPEYDLGLQIDTFGKIREKFPKAGLLIIGAGSLEQTLRIRIESKPYADHILLAGDIPHSATLRAMASSSVILRTTLYDGDSISVREALDLGVPVIATDTGMRPAGLHLIPISDPEALCKAVEAELAGAPRRGGRSHTEADGRNLQAVLDFYELKHPGGTYRRDSRLGPCSQPARTGESSRRPSHCSL